MAFRVPTANVSVVDLTVKLNTETTYDEIMNRMESASKNELKNILGFSSDDVVSQDFIGDVRTSIIDSKAGIQLNSKFYKIITWYDNEAGYSSKLLDLAQEFCK
jgi:glyceraldehyde 3-phosphate dehydrogenase